MDLDRQISQNWIAVERTWRIVNYKHTIEKFKMALASGIYKNPRTRILAFDDLRAQQRSHHARMLDHLHAVFSLTPPTTLTSSSVEEWYTGLRNALNQATHAYKRATLSLRAHEDIMHTSCLELIVKLREDLLQFRVVDDRGKYFE